MRSRRAGNVILFVLVVLVVLGLLGWLLYQKLHPGAALGSGIAGLARSAPADTCIFLALDARSSERLGDTVKQLKDLSQDPALAEPLEKFKKSLRDDLGLTPEDLGGCVAPAGFVAFLPLKGEKGLIARSALSSDQKPLEVVAAIALQDPVKAEASLEKALRAQRVTTNEATIGKYKARVYGKGDEEVAYVFYRDALLVGTGAAALERTLASLDRSAPGLSDAPLFQDALKKLPVGSSGDAGLLWVNLKGSLEGWDKAVPPGVIDDETVAAVSAMEYLAAASWAEGKNQRQESFFKLDPQSKSGLIKALLTRPDASPESARYVPVKWGQYQAFNLPWLYQVVLEIVKLFPEGRGPANQFPAMFEQQMGFKLTDLLATTTGDVAVSSNAMELIPRMLQGNFERARGQGQLTACSSNLKNMATACEMWATDNSGRYPEKLSLLTPNYLKVVPSCPAAGKDTYSASYQVAQNPDLFTMACQGKNHSESGMPENYPRYTAMEGLDRPYDADQETPQSEEPTFVVAVGLKDPAAFQKLWAKLDEKGGMSSSSAGKVGAFDAYEYPGLPARWVVADKLLIVTAGPRAAEMLTASVASGKDALSELPAFKQAVKPGWVALGYQDLGPLLSMFTAMLEQLPARDDEDRKARDLLKKLLPKDLAFSEIDCVTVEADGLRGQSHGQAASMVTVSAVAAAILVPNFIRARGEGQLTACGSNTKNIGTALEMYATDNAGRYPDKLTRLTPDYLRIIPTCPAAGNDTYSSSYQVAANPDGYTLFCSGENHKAAGIPANFPQFNYTEGFIKGK